MQLNLKTLAISLSVAISATTFAQTKLIEKVEKKEGQIVIPYEKYQLPNGLTLLIHEDHSDPICHVDVTYHVGSAREEIGRSGFAHFFEHMMFQGSDHVGDDQHFKIVSAAGGTLNGTTNTDRTNYFETLPSNQLEVALWLEADRMGFLLDAVTQKKFEIQRATVKNERGQNYDNRPYGLVYEKVGRALYPYGHPYAWSTIGDLVDLDRVSVEDLKSFFMRWYGTNNATLTVAGDVTPAQVIPLVEKYFGTLNQCPKVTNQSKDIVVVDKDRYVSYEDNIKQPMLSLVWPSVASGHTDEAAVDAFCYVFGGDKSSTMYQNFIKTQKATEAEASQNNRELAGMIWMEVKAMPDAKLADIEKQLRTDVAAFEKIGITDAQLQQYKNYIEATIIQSLSTVSGKASQLASSQTFYGTPNHLADYLESLKKLTKEDVMRAYNTYVKNKPCVILSVVPKGKSDLAAAKDNFTPKATNPADADHKEYQGLTYVKAKDNFDRSKQPTPGPNPKLIVPALYSENFSNGLKLMGTVSNEIPTVNIQIAVSCGHRFEERTKAGMANMMAALLDEATEKFTSEAISDELTRLGSNIDIIPGQLEVLINISTLTKNLDATLMLVEEKMFHSKFDKEDFERIKNEQLQAINEQSTKPPVIANNVYAKLIYGENSIMSMPQIGTAKSVEAITLDDVKAFYKRYFSPNLATAVIVGDVSKDAILPKLAFLKNWVSTNAVLPKDEAITGTEKTKIFLVNKDKAAQSEIRIGYMAMPFDATGDYFKSGIMNFMLGGAFNSHINMNLREDKGWTYGARSNFSGSKYVGPFTAAAGVKADKSDSSVVEFIKEIRAYATKGITSEELDFTKSSLSQAEALKYESPMAKAGFLKRMLDYNLKPDFVEKQAEIMKNITKEDIDKLASAKLPLDKMIITVCGDKEKIQEGLSKLGYEIVEVDSNGNKVDAINNNKPLYPSEKK